MKKTLIKTYLLYALSIFITANSARVAASQNKETNAPDHSIETFTVTGTYIPDTTPEGRIPKISLNAADIAATATNSFADVLRGIAGIDIFEQGGAGGLTFLSIRGGDPNFVVIVIDGVKVNDPTNSRGGAFDLGTLDPALIEQVDIFYGGFSTLYGSDALAGVINITTKEVKEGKSAHISLKAGTNDVYGTNLHLGLTLADIARASINASYQNGDNSSFGRVFSRKEVIATIKSVEQTKSQWQLGSFYAQGHSHAFPEDSGGDRLAVIRQPEKRDYSQHNLSALYKTRLTEKMAITFNSSWSKRIEDSSNPGIAAGTLDAIPAIDSKTNYKRLDVSSHSSYLLSPKASMAIGLAYTDEDGSMDSVIDFGFPVPALYTLTRHTKSIFAEFGLDPSAKLHITAGIRHDKAYTLSETTHRIIGRYQANETFLISMQYSEGFKLPSFFALGHPFVGNSNLKPERSKNYDFSVDGHFINERLTTRLSIYDNTFADLIDFDPIAFTNVNRSKISAKGTEISISFNSTEQLIIAGQLSYNKIDTFDVTTVMRRRPEWKGSLQVNFKPLGTLSLMARVSINDNYFDSSVPTGMVTMNGSNQVDISATWHASSSSKVRLNINNLFDNNAEQAVGFKNTGRNIMLTLSTHF
jgi:iron complex outermembrane receptor protein/vitamin B12 transporter